MRLKKKLAREISKRISGSIGGSLDGLDIPKSKRSSAGRPPKLNFQDDDLLEIPDNLTIINGPLKLYPGSRKNLIVEINGKNGLLTKYPGSLKIEFDGGISEFVFLHSTGDLLGGRSEILCHATLIQNLALVTSKCLCLFLN